MRLQGRTWTQADGRGITPLGVAVGFNRVAIVTALLEAGADVEQPDARGNTVLHYAAGEMVCCLRSTEQAPAAMGRAEAGTWSSCCSLTCVRGQTCTC